MKARIISAYRSNFKVYFEGEIYDVNLSGNLRHFNRNVIVGDYVTFNQDDLIISELIPAKNLLIRPKIANIDQLLIIMSAKEPDFSSLLVETFLTYANSIEYVKPLVVISKIDLVSKDKLKEITNILEKLAVEYYLVNNLSGEGVEAIRGLLKGKTTAMMGQTGVGKSALINALYPAFNRRTGEYSVRGGRGRHTTREVILFPIGEETFLSDTPGFSSFTLPLQKEELPLYYPGINKYLGECFFNDCQHLSEHNCAVKEAVNEGKLAKTSYENYQKVYDEVAKQKIQY